MNMNDIPLQAPDASFWTGRLRAIKVEEGLPNLGSNVAPNIKGIILKSEVSAIDVNPIQSTVARWWSEMIALSAINFPHAQSSDIHLRMLVDKAIYGEHLTDDDRKTLEEKFFKLAEWCGEPKGDLSLEEEIDMIVFLKGKVKEEEEHKTEAVMVEKQNEIEKMKQQKEDKVGKVKQEKKTEAVKVKQEKETKAVKIKQENDDRGEERAFALR